jgi:hypothetical protein
MAYDFYQGDGFNYTGTLAFMNDIVGTQNLAAAAQPDFSQWAVTAGVFSVDGETQIGVLQVTNNSTLLNSSTNGQFQLYASATETTTWPLGKAQVLIRAWPPQADPITSDPLWLRIKGNPMVITGGAS